MRTAQSLFLESIDWLKNSYPDFRFFMERDLVWSVQIHLRQLIEQQRLPYRVFNDYKLLPGKLADLVILGPEDMAEVAVEFKYEPSHSRQDIGSQKFPVVFWDAHGVGEDVRRIAEFVQQGKTSIAYALFIDEGSAFRNREPHPGGTWLDWGTIGPDNSPVTVHWSEIDAIS